MENEKGPATLEEYIMIHQQRWSGIIAELNTKMKNFACNVMPEFVNGYHNE